MGDKYDAKARDLMDEACLGEPFVSNGVDAALRASIASALRSAAAEERDLIHADASPALSQSGQQSSVPTKTMGEIDYDAAQAAMVAFLHRIQPLRVFAPMTWDKLDPDLQATYEAAADAVIEECAKRIDTLRQKADAAGREDHGTAYYRAAYAIRQLRALAKEEGQ